MVPALSSPYPTSIARLRALFRTLLADYMARGMPRPDAPSLEFGNLAAAFRLLLPFKMRPQTRKSFLICTLAQSSWNQREIFTEAGIVQRPMQ
ncbi:hypothetical protein BFJ68_g10988 [Fusarium oxysporum]|uniref:Uncharacterized protein n=1 Tax=Fusarium oxysporum TaxID=5507 RepID=A0A420QIK5_FUSOX|nr:hypothetical protein BFJ71_g5070 [Fusarium oxysporum]RKL04593.1 hypothetical protein BFJ68_g10988 [Fusarium oxysporum]